MNKLAIFDLDGTLLDTVVDIMDYINITLSHFGYKQRSVEEIKSFIGCGARNLVDRCFDNTLTKQELDERFDFFNKAYTESNSPKTGLFKDIPQLLKELKKRGYLLAIVTNKPIEPTISVYNKYLSEFNFDKVIGSSDKVWCKPDKTATVNLLKELDVLPENTFFIGDGETDVLTSINANVKGIAVLWGYRTRAQLVNAGATVFVNSPLEILDFLK